MANELFFNVKIYLHSVPPDTVMERLRKFGAPLLGYIETMCIIHTSLPVNLIRIIKSHSDVISVRITTTPFQLRQQLEKDYEEYNELN